MNELKIIDKKGLTYEIGVIEFTDFEILKVQAEEVARYIDTVEVNEETIKESKKVLANANKSIKRLNDERIRIKKEMMAPYLKFEKQVKEIESIVMGASNKVKVKVRELEEVERVKKFEQIEDLWKEKTQVIDYRNQLNFDAWFESKFLNKTLNMTKIEENLSNWIGKVYRDVNYLAKKGAEYLAEYFETYDVIEAVEKIDRRNEIIENIENQDEIKEVNDDESNAFEEIAIFEITGKANIKLIEMLLKENEINYRRIK